MDRQSEEQITYLEAADSLNETKYSLSDNIGTDGNLNESEVLNKSPQVEKKTANNQIMRLTQYSAEEVDKLIKKARERFFKRVNCPYCGFTASYTRSLSVHMTRLHRIIEDPQNFCKECNKRVRSLEKHNKRYHSNISGNNKEGSQELLCTYCGKQFKSLAKLTIHVRTHTGEAPYKCSYCDKRTTTRFHLVVHERTHTGEKPHVCSMCGKRFSQSSVLNTHMKLHTGRPEQCSICLKRFCRRSQLRQHLRKHTGEKPYVCSHCGQEFQQKSHLDGHTRTHSTERPYQCEFCEKNFKQLGTLRSHINIHLGKKKPYKCSLCSYTCRRRNRLTQHMTQHENDLPNPDRPYRCQLCDHSFTTQAMFSSHYASKHVPVEESHLPREDLSEEVKIENEGILQSLEQFT
ncbi:hypothetical protein NQ318_016581 [Aromia moschata]|uniref:C2H2-type domain-containing protein n=1 Tax=Aromia moschata TaxID=1265417 RepID=A0AAV8YWG7_9CUCU|nr:hypothetical protein NQ318_016581 [Aromia moschata]